MLQSAHIRFNSKFVMPIDDIENALRQNLPTELHSVIPALAQLLADLESGVATPTAAQGRLTADQRLSTALRNLASHRVEIGSKVISFDGTQAGDVSIDDVAGRDVIKLNVNYAPTAINFKTVISIALLAILISVIALFNVLRDQNGIHRVSFEFDPNYGNGTIIINTCLTANYHWLTSEEVLPNPHFLGRWDYSAINSCIRRNVALGVRVGDVIDIGIGISSESPNGSLDGTQYYRVTRTEGGLKVEKR